MNTGSIEETVACMPKVELHAHLNGSISDRLLKHLKHFGEHDKNSNKTDDFPRLDSEEVLMEHLEHSTSSSINDDSNQMRSLEECFVSFAKIHEVIRTRRILYVAAVNVIAEFSQDNVVYLEIRTGPKQIHDIPSKLSYVETVVRAIKDCQQRFSISVKLLISIDRKNGEEEGFETIKLATMTREKYPDIIVGIDVSGDPHHGHSSWIVGVMQEARSQGLKISCHLPEIVNPPEGIAFMQFGPDRVGHGQYLHPSYGGTDELWKLAKEKKIPVECCISSNLVSGVTASVETHVVKIFHAESIPFVICTDDAGVFKTSLSIEFRKLLTVVPLSLQQLCDLCLKAVCFSFATEKEKVTLTNLIHSFWQKRL